MLLKSSNIAAEEMLISASTFDDSIGITFELLPKLSISITDLCNNSSSSSSSASLVSHVMFPFFCGGCGIDDDDDDGGVKNEVGFSSAEHNDARAPFFISDSSEIPPGIRGFLT